MKMVPDPPMPVSTRSSPKWADASATTSLLLVPQKPRSPASRLAPHCRGHNRHGDCLSRRAEIRNSSFPTTVSSQPLECITQIATLIRDGGCHTLEARRSRDQSVKPSAPDSTPGATPQTHAPSRVNRCMACHPQTRLWVLHRHPQANSRLRVAPTKSRMTEHENYNAPISCSRFTACLDPTTIS